MIKTQFQNGVCLGLTEAVLPLVIETGFLAEKDAEFLNLFLAEGQRQQTDAGLVAILGITDDLDEVIEVCERDQVALKLLGTGLRLTKEESSAAQDDFAAVLDEAGYGFLQGEELGTTTVDREHRDREGGLESGVLVKVVDDDLGNGVALEFDHHARVLV